MYTDFFGLTQRPFGSNAVGDRVYIGPQQVKIISTLGNALSGDDTVVTLSGRIGSGKTTVINRVLESVASNRAVARIGRLQLGPDEVLELLLTEFGVTDLPPGTIQRYNAFKNLLKDWAQSGTRSFIVVEDAKHAGLDALLELEAITASDAGDSPGACILLMGGLDLDEFLQQPQLDRMRQRLRRRTTLEACSESEVHGYLAHCFNAAGKNIDDILEPGAAKMLYRLSEGIPRVINNICETALIASPGINLQRLTPRFLETVALEVFGVTPRIPDVDTGKVAAPADTATGVQESPAEASPAAAGKAPVEAIVERPDQDGNEISAEPIDEVPDEEAAAAPEAVAVEAQEEVAVVPDAVAVEAQEEVAVAPEEAAIEAQHEEVVVVPEAVAVEAQEEVAVAPEESPVEATPEQPTETSEVVETKHADSKETPDASEDTQPGVHQLVVESGFAPNVVHSSDAANKAARQEGGDTDSSEDPGQEDIPEFIEDTLPSLKDLSGLIDDDDAGVDDSEPSVPVAATSTPIVESGEPEVAAEQSQQGTAEESAVQVEATQTNAGADIESTQPQKTLALTLETTDEEGEAVPVKADTAFDPRNHVPDTDDIPTLSDSMRVPIPGRVAEAPTAVPDAQASEAAPDGATAEKEKTPEPVAEDTAVRAAMEIDHALIAEMEEQQFAAAAADAPTAERGEKHALEIPADADESDALATALAAADDTATPTDQAKLNQALMERSAAALAPDLGPDNQPNDNVDLDEWAEELGKAESLDDINDVMAETLFGSVEVGKISAEIVSDAAAGSLQPENPVKLDLADIPDGSPPYPAAAHNHSTNGAAKPAAAPSGDAAQAATPKTPTVNLDDKDEDKPGGLRGLFKRASKH